MSNSIHISEQMDNITTIIFQNTADQMFTGVIDLTALNYKKNVWTSRTTMARLGLAAAACGGPAATCARGARRGANSDGLDHRPTGRGGGLAA
jgi:hypothetical protein